MQKDSKLSKYQSYINLSQKERKKKINQAEQSQQFRRPNPQGNHKFPEINFISFQVEDDNKKIITLTTYRYPVQEQPIAVVIMFHGLNSHIGHGAHIADKFSKYNILTVGFDHRGFGQSQGQPGYVPSLESHLIDSIKFVQLIKKKYSHLPLFCLGLSMGGMTSYYLSLKYRQLFEGAVLMAPALKNTVNNFVKGLTNTLKFILPEKAKLIKPKYGVGSRNPEIKDSVMNDPSVYKDRVRISTAHTLFKAMQESDETFGQYTCPFMIIQGGTDKMVDPTIAFDLYSKTKTLEENKQILFYQQMWHDIWHEQQIFQITEKIIIWILRRVEIWRITKDKNQKIKTNKGI